MHTLISNTVVIIVIAIVMLVSIILLALTGLMYVKKDYEAVVERLNIYKGVYKHGFHYLPAFTNRRVGMYKVTPVKALLEINSQTIEIYYRIEDVKTYHYSGHDIKSVFRQVEELDEPELSKRIALLQTRLLEIGCKLLKKGEIEKNVFN